MNGLDLPECLSATRFAVDRLGFQPDAVQSRILDAATPRGVIVCHRQWGKSTIIAIKAHHRAWCERDSLTLVASPSLRQSALTVRKVETFARKLGIVPRGDGDNPVSLRLPNGSRVVGLPEHERTTVGFSAVSLLIIDEAALLKDPVYHALRPTLLASRGDLWLLSTPLGKRGFFHGAWAGSAGDPAWTRIRVPATDNPRVAPDWLEEERRVLPRSRFAQDYLCEFLQPDDAVFNEDDIQAIFASDIDPLD